MFTLVYIEPLLRRLRFVSSSSEKCPRDDGTNFHFLCAKNHPPPDVTGSIFHTPPLHVHYPLDFSVYPCIFSQRLSKTLILHGARLLNDQPIVQFYYISRCTCISASLYERGRRRRRFSRRVTSPFVESHVSAAHRPRPRESQPFSPPRSTS